MIIAVDGLRNGNGSNGANLAKPLAEVNLKMTAKAEVLKMASQAVGIKSQQGILMEERTSQKVRSYWLVN